MIKEVVILLKQPDQILITSIRATKETFRFSLIKLNSEKKKKKMNLGCSFFPLLQSFDFLGIQTYRRGEKKR